MYGAAKIVNAGEAFSLPSHVAAAVCKQVLQAAQRNFISRHVKCREKSTDANMKMQVVPSKHNT
jgi:hypothetical protein